MRVSRNSVRGGLAAGDMLGAEQGDKLAMPWSTGTRATTDLRIGPLEVIFKGTWPPPAAGPAAAYDVLDAPAELVPGPHGARIRAEPYPVAAPADRSSAPAFDCETDLRVADVELVMAQAHVSHADAAGALASHGGDFVDAIMSLLDL